jgi:hypothetical protein
LENIFDDPLDNNVLFNSKFRVVEVSHSLKDNVFFELLFLVLDFWVYTDLTVNCFKLSLCKLGVAPEFTIQIAIVSAFFPEVLIDF